MPCFVCGNPKTVRSHLMPRAFHHDVRGPHPHAYEGSISEPGVKFPQSGTWDDGILCELHEHALKDSDDYAVRWVRGFAASARPIAEGNAFMVANSRPDLLLKFVSSVVWRHAVSRHHGQYDMDMGPWEVQLRNLIFHRSRYDPAFIVSRQDWYSDQDHLKELIFAPHRNQRWGKRGWEFEVGGLVWSMKLDDRKSAPEMSRMKANGCDPVLVLRLPDRQLLERPGLIDIAVNMERKPDRLIRR